MKPAYFLNRSIIVRVAISIVLTIGAITLYLSNDTQVSPVQTLEQSSSTKLLKEFDEEVNSVLVRFGIEKNWIRKKKIMIPYKDHVRVERTVSIPHDLAPVMMNVAFNSMAHRYEGRAIATENSKDNTTVIHLKLQGYVVQTIILKFKDNLKRKEIAHQLENI
ncbi:MAG TPA: hypothetical protein VFF29_02340 [Bacteroidota bacterium]|nr:hypothetical protein [Bacteroidota bacterium]